MKLAYKCMIIILSTVICSPLTYAGISISNMSLNIYPAQKKWKDFRVYNTGETVAYVEVNPTFFKQPGEKDPGRIENIKNPMELGLLISPGKFAIPPGRSQVVRVAALKTTDPIDRVYSLVVKPVRGELTPVHTEDGNSHGQVSVIVAYSVGTIIRPLNPNPQLSIQRSGKKVTLSNVGNTAVEVNTIEQCSNKECQKLPKTFFLYVGNKAEFEAPKAAPVKVTAQSGSTPLVMTSN